MAEPPRDDPNQDDQSNSPEPDRRRSEGRGRRRRWPYVLLWVGGGLLVILVILAVFLPAAISTQRGKRYLLRFLNGRLRGDVQIQKIDVSWGGPLQIEGVTLRDPQRREVLDAKKVVVQEGLWRLVRTPMAFGQISVYGPQLRVYLQENRPPSLVEAVESPNAATQPARKEPSPATSQPSHAPAPVGRIFIHDGSVRIIRPDGQVLTATAINVKATFDTLKSVQGDLVTTFDSGGAIEAKGHVRNLVDKNGQYDVNRAVGQFSVTTPQPVDIGPIASFADQGDIGGQAHLDVHGTIDRGTLLADLKTRLSSFYAARPAATSQPATATRPRPINLVLVGHLQTGDQQTDANLDLTGDAGTARTRLAYVPSTQSTSVSGQGIIDTLLTGKPVRLPNLDISVQSDLDLAVLADAAPRFVPVRKDVRITKGRLQIQDLAVRTEPRLAAAGGVRLTDLTALQGDKTVDLQPVLVQLNVHVEPDVGLLVEQGLVQSGFAQASVKGTPTNLHGQMKADLAGLDRQLRQLVDLGTSQLAGIVQMDFQAGHTGNNQIDVTSRIAASDLKYISGPKTVAVARLAINPNGSLVLKDNHLQEAILKETNIDMDNEVTATAAASYSFGPSSWKADLTIEGAQIAYLLKLARGLGVHSLDQSAGYRGQIHLPITASYDPHAGVIAASADGAVHDLGVDDKTVAQAVTVKLKHANYAPGTGRVTLGSAVVHTDYFHATASNVEYQPKSEASLRGHLVAVAQIKPTLAAVYTLARKSSTPKSVRRV